MVNSAAHNIHFTELLILVIITINICGLAQDLPLHYTINYRLMFTPRENERPMPSSPRSIPCERIPLPVMTQSGSLPK